MNDFDYDGLSAEDIAYLQGLEESGAIISEENLLMKPLTKRELIEQVQSNKNNLP